MARRRVKVYDKRLISSIALLEQSKCRIFCMSENAALFLLDRLHGARWETSWYETVDENWQVLPTAAEMVDINDFIDALEASIVRGLSMDCEDLINVNVNVGGSGSGSGGCCGTGTGGVLGTGEGLPYPDTVFPSPGTGQYPNNFNSPEEYNLYRCSVANQIWEDWLSTMQNLQTINWAYGSVVDIANAIVINAKIPVPSAIALVIANAIKLVTDTANVYLADIEAWLLSEKGNLVCALYQAQSASAAEQAVWEIYQVLTSTSTFLALSVISPVFQMLVSADIFNDLFNPVRAVNTSYDCSTCGVSCLDWQIFYGVLIDDGVSYPGYAFFDTQAIESDAGTIYGLSLAFGFRDGVKENEYYCGAPATIEIGGYSGAPQLSESVPDTFRISTSDNFLGGAGWGNDLWDETSHTIPVDVEYSGVRTLTIFSYTQFGITVKITPEVGPF